MPITAAIDRLNKVFLKDFWAMIASPLILMGVCVSNDAEVHRQRVLVFGLMAGLFRSMEFRPEFAVTGDFDEGLMCDIPAWVRESKTVEGMVIGMETISLTGAGFGWTKRPPGPAFPALRRSFDANRAFQPE
jgi:hypothetical protein